MSRRNNDGWMEDKTRRKKYCRVRTCAALLGGELFWGKCDVGLKRGEAGRVDCLFTENPGPRAA